MGQGAGVAEDEPVGNQVGLLFDVELVQMWAVCGVLGVGVTGVVAVAAF